MIFIPGDFPFLLILFAGSAGVTTALIIGAIAAGAAAAAGGTAYGIQSAVEGNWPWEDPEAWFTGALRAHTGGLGQVISSAQGEPTIMEQLKGESGGTSRGGGTAGVLQGATGAGISRAITENLAPGPDQPVRAGGGAIGGNWADIDAMEEAPDRSDILKGAWKDIGIGAGTSIGGLALSGAAGGLGSALSAAAPAVSATAPVATEVTAQSVLPAVTEVATKAAPSFASSALQSLQIIPETIGDTASGILQQGATGAFTGAVKGAFSDDPGRGALLGALGGAAGGIASSAVGGLGDMFAPSGSYAPSPFSSVDPMTPMGSYTPPSMLASTPSSLASLLQKPAGAAAQFGVQQAFQPPQPPQPAEPVYASRPSYYDVYDIGGPQATYGNRRPYWG